MKELCNLSGCLFYNMQILVQIGITELILHGGISTFISCVSMPIIDLRYIHTPLYLLVLSF